MKIKQEYRLGVGVSAMLLIFVVISIVTLGVLSFFSARADQALTEKSIAMVRGYYGASAAAQQRLLELDDGLSAVASMEELRAYADGLQIEAGDHTLLFTEDAGNERVLRVTVSLDEKFRIRNITQYSLENSGEWSPGLTELPVF
jgi:hypothetical protein